MNELDFTKEYDVSSSIVEGVYFNENDSTVVLDISDVLYRYSDVTVGDVSELVTGGDSGSTGTHYNVVFKHKFGPAEKLGYWNNYNYNQVPVNKQTPGTPKGLYDGSVETISAANLSSHSPRGYDVEAPTKEHSFNVFDHSVSGSPVAVDDEPTKEFSLTLADETTGVDVSDSDVTITVHFTLDGSDKKHKFVSTEDEVVYAIDELNEYISRFGAKGKVSKVVTRFND